MQVEEVKEKKSQLEKTILQAIKNSRMKQA